MSDEQLFDKPVEAFLADNNLFKWLKSAEPGLAPSGLGGEPGLAPSGLGGEPGLAPSGLGGEPGLAPSGLGGESIVYADQEEVLAIVRTALASWDPNHGSDHDETLRLNLEMQLNAFSEQVLASLPASQRESIRARQKTELGFGYIFVAPLDELSLSEHQKMQLSQLSKQAEAEAATATQQEMDRIQIRNPQAYLAYKLAKWYEQLRKSRLTHGREFFEHSLNDEQRALWRYQNQNPTR